MHLVFILSSLTTHSDVPRICNSPCSLCQIHIVFINHIFWCAPYLYFRYVNVHHAFFTPNGIFVKRQCILNIIQNMVKHQQSPQCVSVSDFFCPLRAMHWFGFCMLLILTCIVMWSNLGIPASKFCINVNTSCLASI